MTGMGSSSHFRLRIELIILLLFLNYLGTIVCTSSKSKSTHESHIYMNNYDTKRQTKQQFSNNNEETIPQYYPSYTTSPRDLSSSVVTSMHSVTNDAVLSTNHNKHASQKTAPHTAERVVYGTDDRQEAASSDSNLLTLFQADVALVASSKLTLNVWGNYDVISGSQGLTFVKGCGYLCSHEPFYNQTVLADCSGVLVGNQHIVTAGHCLTVSPCASTAFLFDFKKDVPMRNISSDNVYFCSGVVSSQFTTQVDYAILQLDRRVVNRTPIPIRRTGEVALGTPLYLVGHPLGTPMKVAGNAVVKSNNASDGFFTANTDSYDKNSGSMVVNGITWQLEGILVRGNADFEGNPSLGCCQSKVCSDENGCAQTDGTYHFEEISKVSTFASLIPWIWNGNLDIEPSQSTIYHYGIGSLFSSDDYEYTLYSEGPTNFTIQLYAPYYGPLLVNGGTSNSSGVLLGPDQNLTVTVEVNTAFVTAMSLGDNYTLTITFKDDVTATTTTRQHVMIITDQPSPSTTPSITPSITPTSSASPSRSPSSSRTPTATPSASTSATASASITPSRSTSSSPSLSPSASPSSYVEPSVCSPCTTNADCGNQGICTNAGIGSIKYCSCFSGYGGCTCADQPSSACQSIYGSVDNVSQKFQASINGSIQAGNLIVKVTAILEENALISVPYMKGANVYPYSQETKIYFGTNSGSYPACNFPRQVSSGGNWKQLAAKGSCLDQYNFNIPWDEAKTKCGFFATPENKTFTQSLTVIRRYSLSSTSSRTETIKRNVTITINEISTNSSNVTDSDVKLFAAITLIEYDAINQDWTVVVRTALPSPYQISSASHNLSGLLETYDRLNQTSISIADGCTAGFDQCEQSIKYTFAQGMAPSACDGLDGGIVTTANLTCDNSLNSTECATLMAITNPVVNISIQLHTGDGCTVVEEIEFSVATLESFSDSTVTTPATHFTMDDIAYFGARVESEQAILSSRTIKEGSVCIRRGATCTPVIYHTLEPSGGKEPVFSIEFLEGDNAAAFEDGTFTLEATIQVTFQDTKKKLVSKSRTHQQELGLNTSIHIDEAKVSRGYRKLVSVSVLLILLFFVMM